MAAGIPGHRGMPADYYSSCCHIDKGYIAIEDLLGNYQFADLSVDMIRVHYDAILEPGAIRVVDDYQPVFLRG